VPGDEWDAARFEAALAPYFEEHERIVFDPAARLAHFTRIDPRAPRRFDVHQVLVDESGDNLWNVEGEIDLETEPGPDSAWVSIRRIGT
jgi:hypothetical protein